MTTKEPSRGMVRRSFDAFDRAAGVVDAIARVFIGVALLAALLFLITQVLVRYILPFPLPWLEEAATYLSAYIAMVGTAVCLRSSYHLQVDLLQTALPTKAQYLLVFFQNFLVFCFALFLVRYGIQFVELGWGQSSPSTYFMVSHARMAMPIGGVLLMLQSLVMMGRALISYQTPEDVSVA